MAVYEFGSTCPKPTEAHRSKTKIWASAGCAEAWTCHNQIQLTAVGVIIVMENREQKKSSRDVFESQKSLHWVILH